MTQIVIVIFVILNFMLLVKIWNMTNDISALRSIFDNPSSDLKAIRKLLKAISAKLGEDKVEEPKIEAPAVQPVETQSKKPSYLIYAVYAGVVILLLVLYFLK